MFNPQVNLYPNVNALKMPIGSFSVLSVFSDIRNGKYQQKVEQLRQLLAEGNTAEYKKQKTSLPAATFSGTFAPTTITKGKNEGKTSYRSDDGLDTFSGLVLYDYDHLTTETLSEFADFLKNNPYIFSFFVSPSGKGLKILFRTSSTDHTATWAAISTYLTNAYGLPVDPSGKDISRLCFVSYDPNIYVNESSDFIDDKFIKEHTENPKAPTAKPTAPSQKNEEKNTSDYLKKCHETVQKTAQPVEGQRNRYAGQFAQQANRWAIPMSEVLDELHATMPDYPKDELAKTVEHHYNKEAAEFGKYTVGGKKPRPAKAPKGDAAHAPVIINGEVVNDEVVFWETIEKTTRSGNVIVDYKLSYDDTIIFLENNGFFKYRLTDGFYQLIRLEKNNSVVDTITELHAKEFILRYLKRDDSKENKQIRELFRRNKSICALANLEGLEYFTPNLRRDTKTTANLYFNNCLVEITCDTITSYPYEQLDGTTIWKKQVRDFDFEKTDWIGCDASEFLQRAITGAAPGEKLTDVQQQKIDSLHTTIGYLLHGYKDPTVTKAVAAVDQVLRMGKENEGRTGKSLLAKMIERVINTVVLDGRNFSLDKPFALQKINPDTRMVNLNDAKKNMDFTRFFGMITEDLDYEKKNMNMLTMNYHDSPKWYISMNSSLQGDGSSSRDRQHIIEFTNYYTDKHKPIHEFKRQFFDDWDTAEWQRFYNFMAFCIQQFLTHGLRPFPLENYTINKLIDRAGVEFVEYMDENVATCMPGKSEHNATELYEGFVKQLPEKFRPKINEFTTRVKMWCDARHILLNPAKNGARDRRNGITYLSFAWEDDTKALSENILTDPDTDLPF